MSTTSAYEQQRLANIERNHAELKRLGLLTPTLRGARPRKRRRVAAAPPAAARAAAADKTSRRSLRLRGSTAPANSPPAPRTVPLHTSQPAADHGDAEWAQALFSSATAAAAGSIKGRPSVGSSGSGGWDRRRAHQHLTLSRCGRVIATTGCAGYGAALAKPPPAAQQAKEEEELRWDVEVLRLGTGGFAVGVAHASMPSPFKSLGNSPAAWVVHCDGRTLHNRSALCEDEAGSSFTVGDTITIILQPPAAHATAATKGEKGKKGKPTRTRQLRFERNGAQIGRACTVPAVAAAAAGPAAGYCLAVQPYMGGAALLL